MDGDEVRFVLREEVFARRPERAERVRFKGLWLTGSLEGLAKPAVAVVGARAPSEAARHRATVLGEALGTAGVCVVSGLALGVDGAAHAGAVAVSAPTIGVLGGGHRHFFPRSNRKLALAMVGCGGGVLSPFPPDEPARPAQFLQRNGVVAALVDAVVIVEAAERSGALNTASWAASFGIDVLAFPGDVERPKAAGCNALIRDGATLVRDVNDVLEALGLLGLHPGQGGPDHAGNSKRRDRASCDRGMSRGGTRGADLRDPLERAILTLLADGPHELDEMLERSDAQPGALLAALMQLELAGLIRSDGPSYMLS